MKNDLMKQTFASAMKNFQEKKTKKGRDLKEYEVHIPSSHYSEEAETDNQNGQILY